MAQELGEAGAASSPWKQPESCRSRRAAGCAGRDAQLIAKRGPAKRPNADERAELVPMPDASWMRPDFASPSLAPILDGDFYPGVAGFSCGFI